jgi:hypothetical protein
VIRLLETSMRICLSALATAAVMASPALAHHSFAMFDMSRNATFKGVVKEVEWTNPHVWVHVDVTEGGRVATYAFEGGAIAVLKRNGWTKDLVKPGDAISLVSHPFKTGRPGGSLERVTLADGRTISAGDAIPGALAPPASPR